MKKLITIFLTLLFVAVGSTTFAQGCAEPTDEGVAVFGFFQGEYDHTLSDPVESTFKFKRARVGVHGNIPYDFYYYVLLEASPFIGGTTDTYLLDGFIQYKRWEWAKLTLGSFKQPFGLEVNTACSGLHTIERAMVSDQLIAPQRDYGFFLCGGDQKETKLFYNIAIMNGTGLNKVDNNERKDVIGRVTYRPVQGVRIGGSYRYGFPNAPDRSNPEDPQFDTRTSYAAEFEYYSNNLRVQAEYINDQGAYDRSASGGCGSEPMILGDEREGMYVMAMYRTNLNLEPVVKYEYFDTDTNIDGNTITWITAGANYWFNDWTRLQLNYQYKVEDGAEVKNDAIKVQVQVKF